MHLEVQGRVLPFWKPPINILKEPDCHWCCSALNISQAMVKIEIYLVGYYKRLKTNAQDCNFHLFSIDPKVENIAFQKVLFENVLHLNKNCQVWHLWQGL